MPKLIDSNIQLLKTIVVSTAVVMIMAGIVMVFTGIRDTGFIDLKAPFIEGKLKTGFTGIALIFLAIVLVLGSFFFRYKDSIEIQVGQIFIRTRGYLGPERLRELTNTVRIALESSTQTGVPGKRGSGPS